jgi:hypothetical protein
MWCKTKQRGRVARSFSRETGKEPSGNSRIRHHNAGHSGNRVRQMIAIARKRKQNSAYTTKGGARPGYPARVSTLWWFGQWPLSVASCQCQMILPVVLVNDGRPQSQKRVLKGRNKEVKTKTPNEHSASATAMATGYRLPAMTTDCSLDPIPGLCM